MAALLVLEERFLEVDVSLGHQHLLDPLVLDVRVAVEVGPDGLAGLRERHVEIVQDQNSGEFPGGEAREDTLHVQQNDKKI